MARRTRQTATAQKPPPKADPRLKFDVPDEQRDAALKLHLDIKKAEQVYMDLVMAMVAEYDVGKGLGKVNIQYDPLTGRFTVTQVQG